MDESIDNEFIKSVFQSTEIRRKPLTGIVKGYHNLPYILVGPNKKDNRGSIKLEGEINVSPKLIFSPREFKETFGDIFEESEPFMDKSIVSRTFSFQVGRHENKNIKAENLVVQIMETDDVELLKTILDDLEKKEKINTGVIWCPHPKFYPISLERFIYSILDIEFN
jgi:hypothetical protein